MPVDDSAGTSEVGRGSSAARSLLTLAAEELVVCGSQILTKVSKDPW